MIKFNKHLTLMLPNIYTLTVNLLRTLVNKTIIKWYFRHLTLQEISYFTALDKGRKVVHWFSIILNKYGLVEGGALWTQPAIN